MLQFVRELFKAATSDALDRMGTTALAVGAGLVPWIASLVRDLTTGGVQAAKANWTGGLLWTACIWLLLLGFSLFRHFRPVLREHRRVFHLLAVSRGSWRQPEPVTARAGRVRRRVRPDWPCRGFQSQSIRWLGRFNSGRGRQLLQAVARFSEPSAGLSSNGCLTSRCPPSITRSFGCSPRARAVTRSATLAIPDWRLCAYTWSTSIERE
jgi:hypothetical protein